MESATKARPDVPQLYFASLVAAGLVYAACSLFVCGMSFFAANGGGWELALTNLAFFAFIGLSIALAASFILVAPLGAAIGLAMLRLTPPAWWQGPLTGALVALALEALVLAFVGEHLNWEWGNAVMLAMPVVLAILAGGCVQRRILEWPGR